MVKFLDVGKELRSGSKAFLADRAAQLCHEQPVRILLGTHETGYG